MQRLVEKIVGIKDEKRKKRSQEPQPPRANTYAAQMDRAREQIFLPEWSVKCVRHRAVLPNQAKFHVPLKMTKFDIKNYLETIYNIQVGFLVMQK